MKKSIRPDINQVCRFFAAYSEYLYFCSKRSMSSFFMDSNAGPFLREIVIMDGVPWTAMGFNATDTVCFGRKQISKLIHLKEAAVPPIFKVGALFGPPLHLLLILIFLILIQLSSSSTGSEFDATGDHHRHSSFTFQFFCTKWLFGFFRGSFALFSGSHKRGVSSAHRAAQGVPVLSSDVHFDIQGGQCSREVPIPVVTAERGILRRLVLTQMRLNICSRQGPSFGSTSSWQLGFTGFTCQLHAATPAESWTMMAVAA